MAVHDPQDLLRLELPSVEEKYSEFRKMFYINDRPELKGSLTLRILDSLLLRSLGLLLRLGRKQPDLESEYKRLTGNFKRMGKVAKLLGRLGSPGHWILGVNFRAYADMVVRQRICEVETRADYIEAARDYFKVADLLDFKMEVCGRDDDKIEFKIVECPLGYVHGDDVGVCMATMEFDSRCLDRLGGMAVIKEVVPEGAPECLIHVVPPGSRVP